MAGSNRTEPHRAELRLCPGASVSLGGPRSITIMASRARLLCNIHRGLSNQGFRSRKNICKKSVPRGVYSAGTRCACWRWRLAFALSRIAEIMAGLAPVLQFLLSAPKLFPEAFKTCGRSSLDNQTSLVQSLGNTTAKNVIYWIEPKRDNLNISCLPGPLSTASSVEYLDCVFSIDVACSAPNGCGADQIPAIVTD